MIAAGKAAVAVAAVGLSESLRGHRCSAGGGSLAIHDEFGRFGKRLMRTVFARS
ncbi:hypothetical protein K8O61_02155 [Xanthomonas cerealis pv. cerealis]|uniref:hypothetical protein n=1 Tax=Xanthomonas cerealis TaxID=3390025 RepID=UPI001F1A322F|nr:hypothetical protein [Xanthomonas translucens]UKE69894.1 hypothetical protein K8O61_02155 [Xanthomonas translucens pv. pistacia]